MLEPLGNQVERNEPRRRRDGPSKQRAAQRVVVGGWKVDEKKRGGKEIMPRVCFYIFCSMLTPSTHGEYFLRVERLKICRVLGSVVCKWERTMLLPAVRQVLEICAHFGGLQAARTEMMGLFVYDLGPIDEEKARVLSIL